MELVKDYKPSIADDEVVVIDGRRLSQVPAPLGAIRVGRVPVGVPETGAEVVKRIPAGIFRLDPV